MDGTEKLKQDLVVLEAMADAMDEYLRSDVLFYPMRRADMPQLTLGGFLQRQQRLLQLRDLLSMEERTRLHEAINRYNKALDEKIVRFEQKAHDELKARMRQWREYLREAARGENIAYYDSAVETRAMIQALLDQLRISPYQLDEEIPQQVAQLDRELRQIWEPSEFVWPRDWQHAYSKDENWWLYGHPRKKE